MLHACCTYTSPHIFYPCMYVCLCVYCLAVKVATSTATTALCRSFKFVSASQSNCELPSSAPFTACKCVCVCVFFSLSPLSIPLPPPPLQIFVRILCATFAGFAIRCNLFARLQTNWWFCCTHKYVRVCVCMSVTGFVCAFAGCCPVGLLICVLTAVVVVVTASAAVHAIRIELYTLIRTHTSAYVHTYAYVCVSTHE